MDKDRIPINPIIVKNRHSTPGEFPKDKQRSNFALHQAICHSCRTETTEMSIFCFCCWGPRPTAPSPKLSPRVYVIPSSEWSGSPAAPEEAKVPEAQKMTTSMDTAEALFLRVMPESVGQFHECPSPEDCRCSAEWKAAARAKREKLKGGPFIFLQELR